MQAHPLSSPAARIPFQSPAPSSTDQPVTTSARPPLGLHPAAAPGPETPPPSAAIPQSSIAQGSGLAHDAGNLLGALGLYCDLLRVPGVLRPEHRHYATELGLISSRSSDLIQRLLRLSTASAPDPEPAQARQTPLSTSIRKENSSARPSPAPPDAFRLQPSDVRRGNARPSRNPSLDHASTLRTLAPVLQRIAAGTASVSVLVPSAMPLLDLPAETIERIAVNLVRNAVEAIRKQQAEASSTIPRTQGEIRVALGILTGRLQLVVEDNGPGVPPLIAAAFMNPSKLPSNAHRGLGHRIVHDLVTSSGGQISVRTRPGHGTVFSMKWALAAKNEPQPADPTAHEASTLYLAHPHPTAALGPAPSPAAQKGLASC